MSESRSKKITRRQALAASLGAAGGPTKSTRRGFLTASAGIVTAGTAVPYFWSSSPAKAESKNDRPVVALIGAGANGVRLSNGVQTQTGSGFHFTLSNANNANANRRGQNKPGISVPQSTFCDSSQIPTYNTFRIPTQYALPKTVQKGPLFSALPRANLWKNWEFLGEERDRFQSSQPLLDSYSQQFLGRRKKMEV